MATGELTQLAANGIRELVLRRRLWPGQQIRQEEIAIALGMSKSPVREALKTLHADGLVSHSPNRGYFIAEVTIGELDQLFRLRRLLETEILSALDPPSKGLIVRLREMNDRIEQLDGGAGAGQYEFTVQNRALHFAMFDTSPLHLMVDEARRLWQRSDVYRAIVAQGYFLPSQARIVRDHAMMIDAFEVGDLARLVELADEHRASAEAYVRNQLAGDASLVSFEHRVTR